MFSLACAPKIHTPSVQPHYYVTQGNGPNDQHRYETTNKTELTHIQSKSNTSTYTRYSPGSVLIQETEIIPLFWLSYQESLNR